MFKNLLGPLLIFFLCLSCGPVPHPEFYLLNQKALEHFESKDAVAARNALTESLEHEAFAPEVNYNLGLAFEFEQEPEKSLGAYSAVGDITSADPRTKYLALFNKALLLAKKNEYAKALETYQRALSLFPQSLEVKMNIEKLLQQQAQQKNSQGSQSQSNENSQDQSQSQKKNDENQKNQPGKDPNKSQDQEKKENSDNNENSKDEKDQKNNEDKNKQGSPKYKPREFKGELHEQDVKKILGELKAQEDKIRSQINRGKNQKTQRREKDW